MILLKESKILNDKVFRHDIYAYVITQINLWMIPILTPIYLISELESGKNLL